jgi:hypothetical protein
MKREEELGPRELHRAVIPARLVSLAGQSQCVGAVPAGNAQGETPRIELVRENGVIRAIDITCGCGQRVRVLCTCE